MKYVIEHPHQNSTKTVTTTATKINGKPAYRIEILEEVYSSHGTMYSDKTHTLVLFEEELAGLVTALNKARAAKLLGIK